jgi:hypothetical protein
MDAPRILTIGHSNHPIERFLALVQEADVGAIAELLDAYCARRSHRPARADLGFTRDRYEIGTSRKHPTCGAE